jgi:hypothetical protein
MTKYLIIVGIILSVVLVAWYATQMVSQNDTDPAPETVSEEASRAIAREWVETQSPTYLFDGMELEYVETLYPDIVGCDACYQFVFAFESRAVGYGDRTGQILAEAITPHEIIVTTENGEVTRVVTDSVYDEMAARTLDDTAQSNVPSGEPFAQTGNLVKDNPGMEAGEWYLVWDAAGAPGLNAMLRFNTDSQCENMEGTMVLCDASSLTVGDRVQVSGQLIDGVVHVEDVLAVE